MRDLFEANFKDRRVLVTGDTGFNGSWLCFWLAEMGAEVDGLALKPNARQPLFDQLGLRERINHHDVDIRDGDEVAAIFRAAAPEYVFHLAAQSLVRPSYEDPKGTFDTNIGGSVNVLEAVRAAPTGTSVVYATSDKCYRNREWLWGYREEDPLGGRDPYSASKAGAEMVCEAYWHSFFARRGGIGVGSVRAGNVIGGGDWAIDRLVPDCVRALAAGRPIVLRNPDATRPWQHVLEPLSGYLRLAIALNRDPPRYGGAWNIGPEPRSILAVQKLAEAVVAAWGSGEIVARPEPGAPHEATALSLAIDKARHLLGWAPRWEVGRAIGETIAWYRAVHDGGDAQALSRAQIEAYMPTGS